MSEKVKQKVEKAVANKQLSDTEAKNCQYRCPLRAWDIIALLRRDYKTTK